MFTIEGVQCIINDTITVSSQINSLEFAELSEVLDNKQGIMSITRRKIIKIFMNIAYTEQESVFSVCLFFK